MCLLRTLFGGQRAPRSDEPDDHAIAWEQIPPAVRDTIGGGALPRGHSVWRCPRHDGRGGVVIGWWWLDENGELVEAFW